VKELRLATFWQRLGALLIDVIVVFLLTIAIYFWPHLAEKLNSSLFFGTYILSVWLGYFVVCQSLTGMTLGKKIFKLSLVNREGNKPSFPRILLRESLGKLLSFSLANLGFISMWLDDEGRCWHDRVSKVRVISKGKHGHKRSVKWFYGITILLFMFEIYPVYSAIKQFVNRENAEKPCKFAILSKPTKTNHFDIYTEDHARQDQMVTEGELFERAFDYAFWSISGIREKVTRSIVCIYSNPNTFKFSIAMDNVSDWAAAYYNPGNNVINFGPDYWNLLRNEPFNNYLGLGTFVYHEIAHYVIDNYFYQNQISNYLDVWFNEGLAEYFSGGCKTKESKTLTNDRQISWEEMDQSYFTNESFDIYDYYRQSCLMAEFLIEKYGPDFPRRVVGGMMNNGLTTNESVTEETKGKKYLVLDKEWQKWLKEEI
jgi:uncharacterized RDD family membrane protein YckC